MFFFFSFHFQLASLPRVALQGESQISLKRRKNIPNKKLQMIHKFKKIAKLKNANDGNDLENAE